MRYFRRTGEGYHAPGAEWGGDPTYWLEVNERGDAERQLEVYPNGNVLRYDRAHPEDEYGALGSMVVDGDEQQWAAYEVSREEFEAKWRAHPRSTTAPSQVLSASKQGRAKACRCTIGQMNGAGTVSAPFG